MNARAIAAIYQIVDGRGRAYIGSSLDVKKRWIGHRASLARGDHHCVRLQRAWKKYGPGAFHFEILEIVEDETTLRAVERGFIESEKPHYNTNATLRGGYDAYLVPDQVFDERSALKQRTRIAKELADGSFTQDEPIETVERSRGGRPALFVKAMPSISMRMPEGLVRRIEQLTGRDVRAVLFDLAAAIERGEPFMPPGAQ